MGGGECTAAGRLPSGIVVFAHQLQGGAYGGNCGVWRLSSLTCSAVGGTQYPDHGIAARSETMIWEHCASEIRLQSDTSWPAWHVGEEFRHGAGGRGPPKSGWTAVLGRTAPIDLLRKQIDLRRSRTILIWAGVGHPTLPLKPRLNSSLGIGAQTLAKPDNLFHSSVTGCKKTWQVYLSDHPNLRALITLTITAEGCSVYSARFTTVPSSLQRGESSRSKRIRWNMSRLAAGQCVGSRYFFGDPPSAPLVINCV